MAQQLSITGEVVLTPPPGCEAPAFPSATTDTPFGLNTYPCPKSSAVNTGMRVQNVSSTSAFVTLSGVGAGDNVTQADTIFVQVSAAGFQVRLTLNNPLGSPIVSVLPINRLLVYEPDAASQYYVTKVEVQGQGTVQYLASGQQ